MVFEVLCKWDIVSLIANSILLGFRCILVNLFKVNSILALVDEFGWYCNIWVGGSELFIVSLPFNYWHTRKEYGFSLWWFIFEAYIDCQAKLCYSFNTNSDTDD